MGRPVASTQNKVIGICFAKSAIKTTDAKMDLVARSGPYSVYQALTEVYPLCIQAQTNFRDGLTEVQLNKALQKAGFKRVRDRRTHATRRTDDPTGAGMYLFSGVRWRDPNDPADRNHLLNGWNAMIKKFPMIAKKCTVEHFLDVVTKFHKSWQPNAERTAFAFDMEDESEEETNESEQGNVGFGNLETLLKTFNAVQPQPLPVCVGLPANLSFLQQPAPPVNQEILSLQMQLAVAQRNAMMQENQKQQLQAAMFSQHGAALQHAVAAQNAAHFNTSNLGLGAVDLTSLVYGANYNPMSNQDVKQTSPVGAFMENLSMPSIRPAALSPTGPASSVMISGMNPLVCM